MKTVKPSDIPALIRAAHQCGLIPLVLGKPGAAKTAMGRAAAAVCGCLKFLKTSPVGKGPQEVLGYGIPNPETGEMKFSRPEDLPTAGDEPTMWFVDELPNADDSVIAEFHSLSDPDRLGRKIGTHLIGRNVLPVFTGNQRKHSRSVRVLSAPLVTRCVTFVVEPDLDEWLSDYASGNSQDLPPLGEFPTLLDVSLDQSDHAKFLDFHRHGGSIDRHWTPDPAEPWDGNPYPTLRGHEAACRVTSPEFDHYGDNRIMQLMLQGILGEETGNATYEFSRSIAGCIDDARQILAGSMTLPDDREKQYQVAVATHRIVRRSAINSGDADAWFYAGSADAYVNNVLAAARGEIRQYLVDLAARDDQFPLEKHSTVQGWMKKNQ